MTVEVNNGVQDTPSPNEDYKNNPLLDENGNPKEDIKPEDASSKEPEETVETKPTEEQPTQEWTNLSNLEKLEKFLGEANLKPSDVAKAISENGGKETPEVLKALEEKHGVGVAALLSEQLAQVHADSVRAVKERDEAVFKSLESEFEGITTQSGAETFKELSKWAETNLPNSERKELNTMLQAGGLSAQLAIKHLATSFKENANIVVPAVLESGTKTATTGGLVPISKAEYVTKLRELQQKGHVYGQSQEIARLDAQRAAGIKRNI